jgi:energy-coupling factor transporter transmembrane protein EcfT
MDIQKNSNLDDEIRKEARSIVNFKIHFTIFILSNVFIWVLSIFLYYYFQTSFIWSVFPTLIWLTIIIFHYFYVYKWNKKQIEKQYIKLVEKLEENNKEEIKN